MKSLVGIKGGGFVCCLDKRISCGGDISRLLDWIMSASRTCGRVERGSFADR